MFYFQVNLNLCKDILSLFLFPPYWYFYYYFYYYWSTTTAITVTEIIIIIKSWPHTAVLLLSCRRRHWGPSTSPMNPRTTSCKRSAACSVSIATTSSTVTAVRTTAALWRTEGTPGCWGPAPETVRSSRCTQAGPGESVPVQNKTNILVFSQFINGLSCCVFQVRSSFRLRLRV